MFENVVETSIFVRILIFAFITIFAINVAMLFVRVGLTVYGKLKGLL